MTIRNTYAAETWDKVYEAFQQINFTAYDYATVKEALLQYLRIYHAENFNDMIESSEMIALLELFAYVAEQMAYRVDMMSHENFISTAQRKQSILRLAKLISYRSARNIPGRGLVKITSIRSSEQIFDSLGTNLQNVTVFWNDPNNTNWKEQFFLIIGRALTTKFGRPQKSFQISDVAMQVYTFNNDLTAFSNGVIPFQTSGSASQIGMEVVPIDLDANGPFERAPDLNSQFNIAYASDGRGDGSDFAGFLMMVKQGSLIKSDYTITEPIENRRIELNNINVNDTDVWLYRVDDNGEITENWERVENLNEQNLFFNDIDTTRKKFEVETLENDRIALLFGDNAFSDSPIGDLQIWTRVSANTSLNIPKNSVVDEQMSFTYSDATSNIQTLALTFALTSAIQNNSASETIEHVRQAAPATYYAQNRMVNGQDYNTFMLKDQSILRLKTINRTFAGQPKYIEHNDASRRYENTKLFGDDLVMFHDFNVGGIETSSSSKTLIDGFIEPLLSNRLVFNVLNNIADATEDGYGISSLPRRKFIEDNRAIYQQLDGSPVKPYGAGVSSSNDGTLNEKSAIQSALDRHWFGTASSFATINGVRHAVVQDPLVNPMDDGRLYEQNIPRTIDGVNTYPPGDQGSGLQARQSYDFFGLRFNRFTRAIGNGSISLLETTGGVGASTVFIDGAEHVRNLQKFLLRLEVITVQMLSDLTTFTVISNMRGRLPDYSMLPGTDYITQNPNTPVNFTVTSGTMPFADGDAFVIDISVIDDIPTAKVRPFLGSLYKVNLNGWWEIIPGQDLLAPEINIQKTGPNYAQRMTFDVSNQTANSWVFLVSRLESSGDIIGWEIFYRELRLVAHSNNTKFWYNQESQILDPETKKPVADKIRLLRSNLDADGQPMSRNEQYDVVGNILDDDGIVDFNKLEVMPTDTSYTAAGTGALADNILQFSEFSRGAYEFFLIDQSDIDNPIFDRYLSCDEYALLLGYDEMPYDTEYYDEAYYSVTLSDNPIVLIDSLGLSFPFVSGNLIAQSTTPSAWSLGRRRKVPSPTSTSNTGTQCNITTGLDFMWQHFSPVTNLIDPSVTNIHDTFILTRGYYTGMLDYIRGFTSIQPDAPTPLELRTAYGYLLENKMLSDTVVLHSGKMKLLFGQLAEPQLRAKFRIVKSSSASFSNERIKTETMSVINTYFDVENWDFGDKFYATELITLIHQRLGSQIASVVLVPTFSVNSFGSLFSIDSGFDEILQSAATLNDIELIDALTPTSLRQR